MKGITPPTGKTFSHMDDIWDCVKAISGERERVELTTHTQQTTVSHIHVTIHKNVH